MPPMMHEEEMQLLAGQPEGQAPARRGKLVVALGLGLAAAATYAVSREIAAPAGRSQLKGLEEKFATSDPKSLKIAAPLQIESDLSQFITADLPEEVHPGGRLGATWGDAAATLFHHIVKKAGLEQELTADELSAFKYRFIASMLGEQASNRNAQDTFLDHAKTFIEGAKPVLTAELAKALNQREHSFQVKMQPWMIDESVDSLNARLMKVPYEGAVAPQNKYKQFKESLPTETAAAPDMTAEPALPEEFKSAEHWSKCSQLIENPRNQGRCGSCWVFGGTGALDSRMCISTDGKFSGKDAELSRGFAVSCAVDYDGCQGGWPHLVYDFIEKSMGIPTTGCDPYFAGSDYANHWTDAMPAPKCPSSCDNRFHKSLQSDLFKPLGVWNYKLVDQPNAAGIEQMKRAIFREGPVPYAFYANNAFMGYTKGVFDSGCGQEANHAVQAIGWGKMKVGWFGFFEKEVEFIQSLNSWGTVWGEAGKFNVAHCVVWHYAIPGTLAKEQHYPSLQ